MTQNEDITASAALIKASTYTVVFTGAGISVESGIPPFRGHGGIWRHNDPSCLTMRYFRQQPKKSWETIRKLFYDLIATAQPNGAHRAIADLEKRGHVNSVITQNIDGLHQKAGSQTVYEYHGTIKKLVCIECFHPVESHSIDFSALPPVCPECGGILKPDFVFFGETIPKKITDLCSGEAHYADVMIVIGTSGSVKPASMIPFAAKRAGATIIEVNTEPSAYTRQITDIFLKGGATNVLTRMVDMIIDNRQGLS
ncbi:MAG: Sir2 family NAD-dependent protein deacetylase [Deltaproteobacteria bacterium]|nr:Sir2 family NAD-dependent protein deacetylase [Deltaproteobacteria bacterium]MBN2688093.1 Sir2 family NAD-dependent protein deacetylase [Deltaproteobacteria bacterium]